MKTRGEGTSVAIIDSSILPSRSDLGSLNEVLSKNFTSDDGTFAPVGSDHGTHSAGIVAAAGNDSANLDTDGDVISLPNEIKNYMSISATGPIGYRWGDPGDGNAQKKRNYPAASNHVEDETWSPAFYTNYGENTIDISAPGGDADLDALDEIDASFEPTYSWKAGTSMAAPAVAGTAALIRSLAPEMSPQEVREHLIKTATPRDPTYHGDGHLDTKAALDALE
ncbi:S8 family serine peptidase [Haladaptatus pallidirubidus]|uniref:S8 family serine peptidase n=1 Tax=Haladaptatus pallidirubidus TaxID=1008152 RepID=UPI001D111A0C|nr:S8 family serine peptidase [Haladaptatus pallidirubidus]